MLGPLDLPRERGAPTLRDLDFELPRDAEACVQIRNAGERRLASSRITLDGRELLEPSDLSPHITEVQRRMHLSEGAHVLEARVTSVPAGSLEVVVRANLPPPPDEVRRLSMLEEMDHALCQETNLALSQLSPEDQARVLDGRDETGGTIGRLRVAWSRWATPSLLVPLPDDHASTASTALDRAQDWIDHHGALFGVDTGAMEVRAIDARDDELGNVAVTYEQRWRGLEVSAVPAQLLLQAGTLRPTMFSGTLAPSATMPEVTVPAVSEADAIAIAHAASGASEECAARVELVVFAQDAQPTLAWLVALDGAGACGAGFAVDAIEGEVIADLGAPERFHVPPAEVSEVTDQVCGLVDETQTAVILAERLVASQGVGSDRSCPSTDLECLVALAGIHQIDETLVRIGRSGWSGTGAPTIGMIPAILPNAPYDVILDHEDPGGAFWAGGEHRLHLTSPHTSLDVIAHESGHAVQQQLRGNALIASGVYENVTLRSVNEGTADALALVSQRDHGVPDLRLDGAGAPIRDYGVRECTGYGRTDTCDLTERSVGSACGVTSRRSGCAEYVHVDLFQDHRLEYQPTWPRISPYLNGCALARPFSLALDVARNGEAFHGVHVDTVDPRIAGWWWRFTMASAPRADTIDPYEIGLRTGIEKLVSFCEENRDNPFVPCRAEGADGRALFSAYYAAGFWSDSIRLGDEATGSGTWRTSTGVAATTSTTLGAPILFVTFGDPTGRLMLGVVPDPFTLPYARAERLATTPVGFEPATRGDPAITLHDGVLQIAYRDRDTDELRVIRGGLGTPFERDARFPGVPIHGSPAVASHGGALYVSYRAGGPGSIRALAAFDRAASASPIRVEGLQIGEHDPHLLDVEGSLVLFTAMGPRPIIDVLTGVPVVMPTRGSVARHHVLMRRLGGVGFEASVPVRRLPLGLGLSGGGPERTGLVFHGNFDSAGPAATSVGGRVHLAIPAVADITDVSPSGTALNAYMSLALLEGALVPASESRVRGVSGGGLRPDDGVVRVGMATFPAGERGTAVLLLGPSGDQVVVRYRYDG